MPASVPVAEYGLASRSRSSSSFRARLIAKAHELVSNLRGDLDPLLACAALHTWIQIALFGAVLFQEAERPLGRQRGVGFDAREGMPAFR